jgi:hypothetical protein
MVYERAGYDGELIRYIKPLCDDALYFLLITDVICQDFGFVTHSK